MYNTDLPNRAELPSSKQLLRSTLLAAITASVLLSTIVLPSEYAIDPTGIGSMLGLTRMGEIKVQLAQEAAKETTPEVAKATPVSPAVNTEPAVSSNAAVDTVSVASSAPARTDQTVITLDPNQAIEIKMQMRKGSKVEYSWSAQGGVVNFDTHGDSPSTDYHGYGKGKGASSDKGTLEAAFDGNHGWFWRNRGNEQVTMTLNTAGEYQAIKKML